MSKVFFFKFLMMQKTICSALLFVFQLSLTSAQVFTISLEAAKDNTIYSEDPNSTSNGSGAYIFAGNTKNGATRRALIQFDLSSIPSEISIDSARLTVEISKTNAGTNVASLYKVTSDWGEAGSNADLQEGKGGDAFEGDATWNFAFTDSQSWNSPGGDFETLPSVSISIGSSGSVTFNSTGLLSDVNSWLTTPDTNFGWLLMGDESSSSTAKRFYSSENTAEDLRPRLTLYYFKAETSIASEAFNNKGLAMYSDFSRKIIQIRNDEERASYSLKIYSILGSLVFEKTIEMKRGINAIRHDIDQAGIYIIKVSNARSSISQKLLFY